MVPALCYVNLFYFLAGGYLSMLGILHLNYITVFCHRCDTPYCNLFPFKVSLEQFSLSFLPQRNDSDYHLWEDLSKHTMYYPE
jgi:hypothetical protein